ncbi:hypothetical protein M8C21_028563 [Ambrosia artemisiifolia]|uniref:Uncharacterized protein n=1 Tax=Ambrosia artemisiifolia TaxID=4212 RepID=A0AAD5C265_AMBAR|nr:hypothetical protein M8C21_028563 [Ambrosia artemisiifolia]
MFNSACVIFQTTPGTYTYGMLILASLAIRKVHEALCTTYGA